MAPELSLRPSWANLDAGSYARLGYDPSDFLESPWTDEDDDRLDLDERSLTGEYDEQETPCD